MTKTEKTPKYRKRRAKREQNPEDNPAYYSKTEITKLKIVK